MSSFQYMYTAGSTSELRGKKSLQTAFRDTHLPMESSQFDVAVIGAG